MNLSPVIISALVQFCLGLGWYDGSGYHIFTTKYLKKHIPRTYHSSTFPLWKKHFFWRKRRMAETGSNYKQNDVFLFNRIPARKRFFQFSPYFPSHSEKLRSKSNSEVRKDKSRVRFNDLTFYSNDYASNAFVRRNFIRPPYYMFHLKSPLMYLTHLNDVGHMHSGTSENQPTNVNKARELSRKPLLEDSLRLLRSRGSTSLDKNYEYTDPMLVLENSNTNILNTVANFRGKQHSQIINPVSKLSTNEENFEDRPNNVPQQQFQASRSVFENLHETINDRILRPYLKSTDVQQLKEHGFGYFDQQKPDNSNKNAETSHHSNTDLIKALNNGNDIESSVSNNNGFLSKNDNQLDTFILKNQDLYFENEHSKHSGVLKMDIHDGKDKDYPQEPTIETFLPSSNSGFFKMDAESETFPEKHPGFSDKDILLKPTLKENAGTLTESSFGKLKDYPYFPITFHSSNLAKPTAQYENQHSKHMLNSFGDFDTEQELPSINEKSFLKPLYNNNHPKSRSNQLGFQSSIPTERTLFNPSNIHFHNKPLEFPNQGSRSSHLMDGSDTGSGFQDSTGGMFVNMAEEGSFNNEDSGCKGITTQTCNDDKECNCYGSFFCIEGKCSMMTASNSDDTAKSGQFWE
ncbi:uncharacterized protein LOC134708629 [Mytilus trossulus]|uniref:uncharacterized protein LOC134708629 n=1 Tax=Mytilus trossulus TaxID=6551 RepID=UPI003005CF20